MNGRYFVLAIGFIALLLLSLRGPDQAATPATVIPLERASDSDARWVTPLQPRRMVADDDVSMAPVAAEAKVWKPSMVPALSPATRAQLKEFAKLKKKVFLDNDEKRRLSELTRDPAFLSSLAPVFDISRERNDEEMNAAVDLLLDAATNEKSETAAAMLMGVIADPSIENTEIPEARRELAAGVKAEILFLWTAASPDRANHMASMLPGPVSQRLWENVLNAQDRNR
ncbi:MAG: hypothetical protein V4760_09125, partial [Bdellovibrionota bacterium]